VPDALLDPGDLRELRRYALAEPLAPRDRAVGERSGRRRQEGPEFVDYRPYVPGDDPRRVDWRVYARLGDLVVRSALAESHIDVAVMIDASASMAGKFRWAQRLAAMLGVVALQSSDAVTVRVLADGEASAARPSTAPQQILALVEEVARLPRGTRTDLARSLGRANRDLAGQAVPDLAVLITDLLVPREELDRIAAGLARSGRSAFLVWVNEPADLETELTGPTELRDVETGETLLLDVNAAEGRRYAEFAAAQRAAAEAACRRHGVGFTPASTSRAPLDLLFDPRSATSPRKQRSAASANHHQRAVGRSVSVPTSSAARTRPPAFAASGPSGVASAGNGRSAAEYGTARRPREVRPRLRRAKASTPGLESGSGAVQRHGARAWSASGVGWPPGVTIEPSIAPTPAAGSAPSASSTSISPSAAAAIRGVSGSGATAGST
jgi:Mg-chelatase subunit ChlD